MTSNYFSHEHSAGELGDDVVLSAESQDVVDHGVDVSEGDSVEADGSIVAAGDVADGATADGVAEVQPDAEPVADSEDAAEAGSGDADGVDGEVVADDSETAAEDEIVDSDEVVETAEPEEQPTFADLGLMPQMVEALSEHGIDRAFPIQTMTMPLALEGQDLIGQAKTGTGKTLGFSLPLLQRVKGPDEDGYDKLPAPGKPQALVVAPTRELALQVHSDMEQACAKRSVRLLTVYGGKSYEPQIEALAAGVDVIVGTPGRILDLVQQKLLVLAHVTCLVLDEADEMLDLGFLPDVERILNYTSSGRQTMLFSATMPGPVVSMARQYMNKPTHIRAQEAGEDQHTVDNIRQVVYRAHSMDKCELLARILQARGRGLTMIFSKTKRAADKVAIDLRERGFAAGALHGDLGQIAREKTLAQFREGKLDMLVCTDVAARGIDIDDVTHVINYQCPDDEKTYLHRIGRTGRAGRDGVAVTFVDWEDITQWRLINKALSLQMPTPPETYSTSIYLYTDLEIPANVTGTVGKPQAVTGRLARRSDERRGRDGSGRGGSGRGRDGAGRGRSGRGSSTSRDSNRGGSGRGRSGRGRTGRDSDATDNRRSTGRDAASKARSRRSSAESASEADGVRRRRRRVTRSTHKPASAASETQETPTRTRRRRTRTTRSSD